MGYHFHMGSHSDTFHPTQVTRQAGTQFTSPGEGWKAELT